MGLLLGGSVLTVFELLDLITFHFLKTLVHPLLPDDDEEDPEKQSEQEKKDQEGQHALDSGFSNSLAATPDWLNDNRHKDYGIINAT